MRTLRQLLLSLTSFALVSGISSCAPSSPDAWYNITSPDMYGNYVTDVITVTNEARIPMPDGHKVDVRSLVTGRSWVKTFPHIAFEGQNYLLWSNNQSLRVTATEGAKHASILRASGASGYQDTSYSYSSDSSSSSSSGDTERCSACGGSGRVVRVSDGFYDTCYRCGGDGNVSSSSYNYHGFPTYFLIRNTKKR